jgi:hypothetical protein
MYYIKGQPRCMKLPRCAGSGEGLDHLGSLYATFLLHFLQVDLCMYYYIKPLNTLCCKILKAVHLILFGMR